MELHWASAYDKIGNALGYSTHQKHLKKALEEEGVTMDDTSGIAVSIVTPDSYQPIPGKYNILYTMYECTTIPDNWIEPLNKADLIVVPCKHNQELFKWYTKKPIEICWEGVNTERYYYTKRAYPKKKPFTFLWVGASNPRKGYEHVVFAWSEFCKRYPDTEGKVQLIMKTTQVTREERLLEVGGNVIVDTRYLPFDKEPGNPLPSMAELYQYAHAFLLPSMGEGFGLTLAEAMSTGLPCIYTPWSGVVDFCSVNEGFPVKWKFVPVVTKAELPDGTLKIQHRSKAASADPVDIAKQMHRIYTNYEFALKKGKRAAERIRRDITWDKSARSFMKIVNKYTQGGC